MTSGIAVLQVVTQVAVVQTATPIAVVPSPAVQVALVQSEASIAVVGQSAPAAQVTQNQTVVAVVPQPAAVFIATQGERGPAGPQGLTGDAATGLFTAPAGGTIFAGRAVAIAAGSLYHPRTSVLTDADKVIGIATQSTSTVGAPVSVRARGKFVEPGAAFVDGLFYCTDFGVLSQTPPAAPAWLMVVGRGIDSTSFDVDVEQAIHRV